MELLGMLIIVLQIATVFTKKHKQRSSSEESIENLLYYKDCKHKLKSTTAEVPIARAAAAVKPECPCPRMCCSMCCDCSAPQSQSFLGRAMTPLQQGGMDSMQMSMQMQPSQSRPPSMPMQPQILQRGKKKKIKPKLDENMMQPPIGGRRDFSGFTRENIKSLISQDEDIKKILKDLVKVTMKKVDLVDLVKKTPERKVVATDDANSDEED